MGWHVAVIGTGHFSRAHLAALASSEHVSQITLVGRNESALAVLASEFPTVTATQTEIRVALQDDSVQLIDVVLPHYLHAEISSAALRAGKHVICEKPGSLSLDQLDQLCATAAREKRRLLVVMNQLYNPLNQRIGELVAGGAVGRPFLLVETAFSDHSHYYRDPKTWRTRRKLAGGGVLIDGGYHMVYKDLAWLAGHGEPRWVSSDAAQLAVDPAGQIIEELGEDYVSYVIGYDEPLRVVSSHAWTLATDLERRGQTFVAGTEATLELSGAQRTSLVLRQANDARIVEVPGGPMTNVETLQACLHDYVDAIVTGRPPLYGSLAMARSTLEIILAVYDAAASGRRIALGDLRLER